MHLIKEKIIRLRRELRELEESYYSGSSTTDNEIYDYKLRELIELEQQHPSEISEDSPTQKVGYSISSNLEINHKKPMLSLNNAFDREDIMKFFDQCEEDEDLEYILEPKIDGASISLIYRDGYLKHAISRGNGSVGEELVNKVINISNIPLHLPNLNQEINIRGEIYITKSDFDKVKKTDSKIFSNHRNFISGTLRLKKSELIKDKKLRFRGYEITNKEDFQLQTQRDILNFIKKLGFETHDNYKIEKNKGKIFELIEEFRQEKENGDVPCDGLVLKINDFQKWEKIGYTSKFPKWAIAYKYPNSVKESKLLEITGTVGRTGRIAYTATIEPIEIEGSVVKHATLHNANYILELDLRIGDYVGIYKSGDVIPKIIGNNISKREGDLEKWVPLENCPCCKSKLISQDNLIIQYCKNEDCEDKQINLLIHWCSRPALDIKGISENIIKKLWNKGFIRKIYDIYHIHSKKIEIINSNLLIKEKTIDKLIDSVEKSKNKELDRILFGLGIQYIGSEAAKLIAKKLNSIELIMSASKEDYLSIDGIGEKGAESIYDWLQKQENIDLINKLRELGLFKTKNNIVTQTCFLTGKHVVITGTFAISRSQLSEKLSTFGALVQNQITTKTEYLLAGENGSINKLEKAQKQNIDIIKMEDIKTLWE